MKDSKGRDYDGWVLRSESGRLLVFSFCSTRTAVRTKFVGLARVKLAKVRLVEVE